MARKQKTVEDTILKNRLDKCPHCGVLIARHMVYPDTNECVYTQDEGWLALNSKLDTKSLLIRKGEENEIAVGE